MKKKSITTLTACILSIVIGLAGCKEQPSIQLESGQICTISLDGTKDCKPIDEMNLVLLQRVGQSTVLTSVPAPSHQNPNFPGDKASVAHLHQALQEHGMVYDFDPSAVRMDWSGPTFIIMDKGTGDTLLAIADADSGPMLCFSSEIGKNSIAAASISNCNSPQTRVLDSFKEGDSAIAICDGMLQDVCRIRVGDQLGPVIIVDIPNIIGDTPGPARVQSWKELFRQLSKVEIGPHRMIDFRVLNPLGGNSPQFHSDSPSLNGSLSNEDTARRSPNFTRMFESTDESLLMYGCNTDHLYFEAKGERVASLFAKDRAIVIEKECEGRCLAVYAENQSGADDWVKQ